MPNQAISLMFHDVVDALHAGPSGFSSIHASAYKVTTAHFRALLDAIGDALQNSSRKVSLLGASSFAPHECPLLLTFDDGGSSSCHPAADMLEEHGWRGHFFIPTDFIGKPGFASAGDLRELRRRGHAVGTHSCSHPIVMTACSPETLLREWSRSVETLSDIIGERVTLASLPGGYYSGSVAAAASACGIRAMFTSEPMIRKAMVDECRVYGRFAILSRMSPSECAGLAAGRWYPHMKQRILWNGKKLLKRVSVKTYLRFRNLLGRP